MGEYYLMGIRRLETADAYLTEIKETENYLICRALEMNKAEDPKLRRAIGDACNPYLEDLFILKGLGSVAFDEAEPRIA